MATFPSYAKLLVEGFEEIPGDVLIRTAMEDGPPKQAKIRYREMISRPVNYRLVSKTDYNSFMTWYRTTINNGSDWFTWTDPVSGSSKNARIIKGSFKSCRPLIGRNLNGAWTVSFTLETWE